MDMTSPGLAYPKATPRVITRKVRAKQDAQAERDCRRIVRQRDHGRCVVPGCLARERCEMHHVVPRSQSKASRWLTSNNCLLCPAHHRLRHSGKISIGGNADLELIITGDLDALRFRL